MNHMRQNCYKEKGFTVLFDKECQVVRYLGGAFYATVRHVISKHCGRVEGRIHVNGHWQKVRQVSRGNWEAI